MVFTKLSVQEKDAFFGLLDEYFQSRPELFGQNGGQGMSGTGISTVAAASAVQRALATNAMGASGTSGKSTNPFSAALAAPNNADAAAQAVTVGRVAAASLAFSQGGRGPGGSLSSSGVGVRLPMDGPPSLPRRAEQTPGSEVDKLVARKASALSAFKKPSSVGVTIPSAFVTPTNNFGPPPVRRVISDTGAQAGTGTGPKASAASPPEQDSEFAEGEWAEVLYDYGSEDPGDLAIEAGTRVFVTAKSSEDWWTGRVEGQEREGLFPASYVKLL